MKDLKYILPILALVLSGYGFIYSKIYYQTFGINIQDFFSVQDYIQANVDNITSFLWVNIGWILLIFWTRDLLWPNIKLWPELKRPMSRIPAFLYSGIIATIPAIYFTFINKEPVRYVFFMFVATFFWIDLYDKIISQRIQLTFKDNFPWLYWIIYFVVPLTLFPLYTRAKVNAAKIIEQKKPTNVKAVFKDDFLRKTQIEPKHLLVIGSNSMYFFFYDTTDQSSHIIPLESVENVIIKPKTKKSTARPQHK